MDKQQLKTTKTETPGDKTLQSLLKNIEKLQSVSKTESRRELLRSKIEIYKELSCYLSNFNPNLSIDDKNLTFLFDSHFSKYNSGEDSSVQITESNQNFFKELFMFFLKREPTQGFDDSEAEDEESVCKKRIKKLNFHQP